MQSADRTAALPSTAFALLVLLQFPTITSDTKERAISWLLGRAERNPFSFALSSLHSPLDLNLGWSASAPCCCWWDPSWEMLALARPQGAAAVRGGRTVWPRLCAESAAGLGFVPRASAGQRARRCSGSQTLQQIFVLNSHLSAPYRTCTFAYLVNFFFNFSFSVCCSPCFYKSWLFAGRRANFPLPESGKGRKEALLKPFLPLSSLGSPARVVC